MAARREDAASPRVDEPPGEAGLPGLGSPAAEPPSDFEAASRDRSKAFDLKMGVDHPGIFARHEDRFLDLFGLGST